MLKEHPSNQIKRFSFARQLKLKYLGYAYEQWNNLQAKKVKAVVDQKKFLIYTSDKNASSSLVTLLEANPFIYVDGAVLKWPVSSPVKLIKNRCKRINQKVYGFKMLSEHCQLIQPSITCTNQFFRQMSANGFQVIYVENENPLKAILAKILDHENPSWRKNKNKRMVIDFDLLMDQLTLREQQTAYEKAALNGISHLILNDEKDFESLEKVERTVTKIASFLDTVPIRSPLKITTEKIQDGIANIEDLFSQLSNTRYRSFIKKM